MKRIIFTIAALAGAASVMLAAAPDTVWTARHKHEVNTRLEMTSSCLDNEGRVFFVGYVYDPPYMDLFALKVDPRTGDTLWNASYRTTPGQLNWASDCTCDSAGNLYLVGATAPGHSEDMLAVKFDGSTGTVLWDRTWNCPEDSSDYAEACDVDKNGNLYTAGTTNFAGRQTINVMKIDPFSGDTLWSLRFPGEVLVVNEAISCLADSSGALFVVAETDSSPIYRFKVYKFNAATGDTLWTRSYDWDMATNGAMLDPRGFLYVTGWSNGQGERTIKLRTENGDTVWNKYVAITQANLAFFGDYFRQGDVDSAGDYYFAHTYWDTSLKPYINLVRYRGATGDTSWSRSYSVPSLLDVVDCRITPNDSVLIGFWRYHRSATTLGLWYTCNFLLCGSASGDSVRMNEYTIKRDYQEQGLSCLADRSGNLYQVGYYDAAKNVVKASANDGMTEWEMRYFFYNPQHVISNTSWKGGSCVDAEGYVYVTGEMINSPPFFTLKLNPATGDTIWADKHYDWRGDACCLDDSGHLFVVGRGASIIKYDALTGARIAQQTNTLFSDTLYDCVSSRGLLFAVGFHEDFFGKSAFVLKNLNTGAMDSVWTRTYDLIENVHAIKCYGCALSKDSSLCLAGEAVTNDGFDYLLEKIDTLSGNVRWERSYGGPAHGMDIAYDCAVDSSGNIYVTGASGNGNDFDYLTVCYTPSGDTLWSKRYDGPDHRNDIARGIAIDSLGYLYVTGSSQNACNYDMVTVKYGSVYAGVAGNARAAAGPGRFKAFRSAPNPFRQRSQISFTLPAATAVDVRVYNAAGQLVRTLQQGQLLAGAHSVPWDGRDNAGRAAAAGVYLYRIAAGTDHAVGKMVLVR